MDMSSELTAPGQDWRSSLQSLPVDYFLQGYELLSREIPWSVTHYQRSTTSLPYKVGMTFCFLICSYVPVQTDLSDHIKEYLGKKPGI